MLFAKSGINLFLDKYQGGPLSQKFQKDIFEFNCYHTFLNEYVNFKKETQSNWSYSQWARDLNLKSTSSITKVLTNERLPGKSIAKSLITYFGFNDKESYYFLDLIELEKTKDNPALQKTFIQRVKANKVLKSFDELQLSQFKLVSDWYYFAIRELTRVKGFKPSSYWIHKAFKKRITIKQINEAIKSLLQLGLLEKKEEELVYTEKSINTQNDFSSLAIKSYHSQVLHEANDSLYNDDVKVREFQAGCFSFKKKDLPQAKEMIRNFIQEFASLHSKDNGEDVYQFAVQFFPLTDNQNNKAGTK